MLQKLNEKFHSNSPKGYQVRESDQLVPVTYGIRPNFVIQGKANYATVTIESCTFLLSLKLNPAKHISDMFDRRISKHTNLP